MCAAIYVSCKRFFVWRWLHNFNKRIKNKDAGWSAQSSLFVKYLISAVHNGPCPRMGNEWYSSLSQYSDLTRCHQQKINRQQQFTHEKTKGKQENNWNKSAPWVRKKYNNQDAEEQFWKWIINSYFCIGTLRYFYEFVKLRLPHFLRSFNTTSQ